MQNNARKTVVIGSSESALDRRERLLEAKREREATENNMKKLVAGWLNEGKDRPIVFFN